MKGLVLLVVVAVLFMGCTTIPEEDLFDGELSEVEAGYVVLAVCDALIIGMVVYGIATTPPLQPRANPADEYYEGD
jgi:hypothetical protein